MTIDFDVRTDQYRGQQTLAYTNNSPDTLNRVFYHLYFNAFQPGSMMDQRNLSLADADERRGQPDQFIEARRDRLHPGARTAQGTAVRSDPRLSVPSWKWNWTTLSCPVRR